jgi:hypothetical protein
MIGSCHPKVSSQISGALQGCPTSWLWMWGCEWQGVGIIVLLDGNIVWRSGQWVDFYEKELFNLREMENIVLALE